jgi:ATP-dependent DNA helicase RecG
LDEVSQFDAKAWADKPIPIYPASASVTTWMIQKALGIVLDTLGKIEDEVPEQIAKKHKLMSLNQAFEKIHRPETKPDWSSATKTLSYHEAFLLQANLNARKIANEKSPATIRSGGANGFLTTFDSALPFNLTKGQQSVGEEISLDLAKSYPMNRLLQGEVGSGKTLVALRAMLAVADTEGQSALLAPTEVWRRSTLDQSPKASERSFPKKLG